MNYIKPTMMFTPLSAGGLFNGQCTTTNEDMELISEILGVDPKTSFGMYEECTNKVDTDMYCMFTSVDNGAAKVLGS